MNRRPASGFTLVEVLVALAILAITMVLAYRATAALADGEARLSEESARWRSLDAALSRFESDLRQAIPRAVRRGDRRDPPFVGQLGNEGDSGLAISRAGPEFSQEPGVAGQRIAYRATGGRLEVLYWPALDNDASTAPTGFALVEDVARFRLDYLDRAGEWTPTWPVFGEPDVPRAVRVRLVLAGGETIERWIALR